MCVYKQYFFVSQYTAAKLHISLQTCNSGNPPFFVLFLAYLTT